jgi:exodeoxyribonuclease VII small subunit
MARKSTDTETQTDVTSLTFEQAMEELETIIERIERGEIGLEESLAQRKRGDALVKRCRDVLDAAEQELQQIKPGETQS